jgi:hypothetical protein
VLGCKSNEGQRYKQNRNCLQHDPNL